MAVSETVPPTSAVITPEREGKGRPAIPSRSPSQIAKAKASCAKGGRSPRLPEKDRQIRQEIVLMKTICGEKAAEIAKELNTSLATVKTDLVEARRSGMVMIARDRLVGMIPKALAVLDHHLDEGDKDVALVILEGLGIIGKYMQINVTAQQAGGGGESFEAYRNRIIQTKQAGDQGSAQAGNSPGPTPGGWIDAQVTARSH